jgi:hypothetical protein
MSTQTMIIFEEDSSLTEIEESWRWRGPLWLRRNSVSIVSALDLRYQNEVA